MATPSRKWWPDRPLRWAVLFSAAYALVFVLSEMLTPLWEVVPDRVSLVYLPAFVRVVAVLVAGLAGALGVAIGSFVVCIIFVGDSLLVALGNATASAAGIGLAYAIVVITSRSKELSFELPVLARIILIYSALNALLHAAFWNAMGSGYSISLTELGLMMFGDLAGVVFLFYVSRLLLRTQRMRSLLARSTML
jgi:hypothetical protein